MAGSFRFQMAALCGVAAMLLAGTAAAQNFTVPFAPTGIAYDAGSQRVYVSGQGHISGYTNGVESSDWGTPSGNTDLAAGTNGTVLALNGGVNQYAPNGLPVGGVSLPSGTLALGSELTIGGTNYLLYATTTVYALNVANSVSTALFAVPAGFNVTGGDWCLRPNGSTLADTLVVLSSLDEFQIFYPDGEWLTTIQPDLGTIQDACFGGNKIYACENTSPTTGGIEILDFTIPAAIEPAVSVGGTNGPWQVVWSGRQLQAGTNLRDWQTLTNAPQPYPLAATNAAQFFRAVK